MTDIELLPCPFCGLDVTDDEGCFPVGSERTQWEVRCGNPSCYAHDPCDKSLQAAAARWNRRATAARDAVIKALRAEVERLRTDGASAVRWAPGSAYWSEVLVELFGPDARKGIDVLEARWRKALERAERLEEALREMEGREQRNEALLRQALEALEGMEKWASSIYDGYPPSTASIAAAPYREAARAAIAKATGEMNC